MLSKTIDQSLWNRMTIVTIIQARMGSTRLPGKVMMDLSGHPVLWHIISRVQKSRRSDKVLVATTKNPEDIVIEKFCKKWNIPVYRGNVEDVLQRYCDAVIFLEKTTTEVEYIIRITGDCPFVDPEMMDEFAEIAVNGKYDYVSNVNPPTYPDGLDIEIFSRKALFTACREAILASEHEHVTPYIRKSDVMRKINLESSRDLSYLRLTLDNLEDYILISRIYSALYDESKIFTLQDILIFLQNYPDLLKINSSISRNEGYQKSLLND